MPMDEPQAFTPASPSPAIPGGWQPVADASGGDAARRAEQPPDEPMADSAHLAREASADAPVPESAGPPPAELSVAARIRQRVADLDGIENLPLAEHAELYSAAHAALQAALSEIDTPAGG